MTKSLVAKSTAVKLLLCMLLAVAGLDAALASRALAAAAPTPVPPPAELAPLLQKTSELQLSSERFSGEVTITGKKLPRKLKALGGLKQKTTGEVSTSPQAASITETTLGRTILVKLIGNTVYFYEPSIAKLDGGRPWVAESLGSSGGAFGSNPSLGGGSGGSSGSAPTDKFKTDTALLKASKDVRSLGASTIDGQAVTGFAGSADPKEIEQSTLPAKLREAVVKSKIKPSATFEIFLAANGLPVRSHVMLALAGVKLNVSRDIPAIDFPVAAIAPPPAAETITGAQLKKILLAKLKKKKKK
jgi:hypothetical protein